MRDHATRPSGRAVRLPAGRIRLQSRAASELGTLRAFRTIFAAARSHDAEVRRVAGIAGSQLWALSEIGRASALSVNELSERMALHQTTASNLVNALVERKLARRQRDAADQRVVRLYVTADGKRMLRRSPGPYTGLLVDALRQLAESELTALAVSLSRVVRLLRRADVEAAGRTLLGE